MCSIAGGGLWQAAIATDSESTKVKEQARMGKGRPTVRQAAASCNGDGSLGCARGAVARKVVIRWCRCVLLGRWGW